MEDDIRIKNQNIDFDNEPNYTFHVQFVLDMLDYKKNGHYVELGASTPYRANNTALLEKQYDWKGVGLETVPQLVEQYNKVRKNECINEDALKFNYLKYFEENNFPKQIDYLQVDVDEGVKYANLLALIAVPLNLYRFSVITFEHDSFRDYRFKEMRDTQRIILDSLGYSLLLQSNREDWWIDPSVINHQIKSHETFVKYGWLMGLSW